MSKHTPGPWIAAHRAQVQDKKLGGGIALCNRYAPYDAVDQANANLIAAAPDLLEALENLADAYEKYKIDDFLTSEVEDARAAIAKARGDK